MSSPHSQKPETRQPEPWRPETRQLWAAALGLSVDELESEHADSWSMKSAPPTATSSSDASVDDALRPRHAVERPDEKAS